MIQDVAEKQGNIDVDVVTGALARSTQRIMGPKYMIAGGPDGGACHPRDNIALRWMAQDLQLGYDLFGSIMQAREAQTELLARRVIYEAREMPIVIVGKAYKPGVDYLEGSGSLLVEHYIKAEGLECHFLDKYTDDTPSEEILSQPCLYLLMHDAAVTYCDSVLKDSITKQEIRPVSGSVIIDLWRKQKPIPGCKVIHYGNTRKVLSLFKRLIIGIGGLTYGLGSYPGGKASASSLGQSKTQLSTISQSIFFRNSLLIISFSQWT
jgi:UDPglucose 6-dehydrogenase